MWKLGSMKFLLAASGLALLLAWIPAPSPLAAGPPPRANELTLAGLRPGRDTLPAAKKLYGDLGLGVDPGDDKVLTWRDPCRKRILRIEADSKAVIQTISVEDWNSMMPCRKEMFDKLHSDLWRTGHGISLGDPQARVASVYGPPGSGGPSTDGGRDLQLMYYAFDWAGSDVPQVMEIFCDQSTSKVVHITLAYPSL